MQLPTEIRSQNDPRWCHREIMLDGLRVHLVEEGDGPIVILLHGFPEFWYSWRHQIPHLAAAGFRVIAPDLRGYNLSGKPAGVRAYGIDRLVSDVVRLIDWAGIERAHIVGHDWGGIVAWYTAMHHPEVIERLAILNAPHPDAYLRECKTSDQMRRSWYGLLFQIPRLPEFLLRSRNAAAIARAIGDESRNPDECTPEILAAYREAALRPGALTGALNYYRALARPWARAAVENRVPVEAETLVVWGTHDRFLSTGNASGLEQWVPRVRVELLPNAGHWVQTDEPTRTSQLLIDFLSET